MLRGNRSTSPAEPGKVILKKYGKNRRLYDTSASRYVNLEEVAALIRNGTEVRVVDAQTGEDLTRVCLVQIIMEDAREKPTGLPLELLRQLIVASDHVGREFIMGYLKSAFDTYRKVQDTLESGLTGVHSAASSPLQIVKNFLQGTVSEKRAERDESEEIKELRRRLTELEGRPLPNPTKKRRSPKSEKSRKSRG
jgi:polyhydroxyalkanoate synthesis repressor PhaR